MMSLMPTILVGPVACLIVCTSGQILRCTQARRLTRWNNIGLQDAKTAVFAAYAAILGKPFREFGADINSQAAHQRLLTSKQLVARKVSELQAKPPQDIEAKAA